MVYNSTKSYIITRFVRHGYSVTIAEKVYNKMILEGLSFLAVQALTTVLLSDEKVCLRHVTDIDMQIQITKYIDSLSIDDFAKSSFIGCAAKHKLAESHEQWKRELNLFMRICN